MVEARAACLNGCSRSGSDGGKQLGLVVAGFELSGWCSPLLAAVLASVAASQKMKEHRSLQPRRIFQSELNGGMQRCLQNAPVKVAQPRSHSPSSALFLRFLFTEPHQKAVPFMSYVL